MTAPSRVVLSLRGATKTYGHGTGRVTALANVTVDIEEGRFTAIMGPSGSGKSTLMNLAAGLDDPTSGEVWLAGHGLHLLDEEARTVLRRTHVGFVFQAFNLVPTLTAMENVLLPLALAGRRLTREDDLRVDRLLGELGLDERRHHRPGELSGGQQQRVAIARALAGTPSVVIADEPTGNLDTRSSREVLGLLGSAVESYGQTIVMVSHDPVAASRADRILMITDGRIVGDHPRCTPEEIASLLIELEVGAA
ncbi:ABC transporter ATP-binding protein [Marmoricola sp. URHB0036]|uniref:ABC transporter ATP-binding protein n=1 Tax=Marmoricola sp. URHB0036 TaxID=1298863 RepID=UPI0004852300|nr:ABC transporter ATP-binding protein [Marmoricola sp. URHB0036]